MMPLLALPVRGQRPGQQLGETELRQWRRVTRPRAGLATRTRAPSTVPGGLPAVRLSGVAIGGLAIGVVCPLDRVTVGTGSPFNRVTVGTGSPLDRMPVRTGSPLDRMPVRTGSPLDRMPVRNGSPLDRMPVRNAAPLGRMAVDPGRQVDRVAVGTGRVTTSSLAVAGPGHRRRLDAGEGSPGRIRAGRYGGGGRLGHGKPAGCGGEAGYLEPRRVAEQSPAERGAGPVLVVRREGA